MMEGLIKLNNSIELQAPKISDWILKQNTKTHLTLEVFLNFDIAEYGTNSGLTPITFQLLSEFDNSIVNLFTSVVGDFQQEINTIPDGSSSYTSPLFSQFYIVDNNMLYNNNSISMVNFLRENTKYSLRMNIGSNVIDSIDKRIILPINDSSLSYNPVNLVFGSNNYTLNMNNYYFESSDILCFKNLIGGIYVDGNTFTTLSSINNSYVVSDRNKNLLTDFSNTAKSNIIFNNSSSGSLVINNGLILSSPSLINFTIRKGIVDLGNFTNMNLSNMEIGLNHLFNYQSLSHLTTTSVSFVLYNPLYKLITSGLSITNLRVNYVGGAFSDNTITNISYLNGLFTFNVNYEIKPVGTYPLDSIILRFSTGLILKMNYIGKNMIFI